MRVPYIGDDDLQFVLENKLFLFLFYLMLWILFFIGFFLVRKLIKSKIHRTKKNKEEGGDSAENMQKSYDESMSGFLLDKVFIPIAGALLSTFLTGFFEAKPDQQSPPVFPEPLEQVTANPIISPEIEATRAIPTNDAKIPVNSVETILSAQTIAPIKSFAPVAQTPLPPQNVTSLSKNVQVATLFSGNTQPVKMAPGQAGMSSRNSTGGPIYLSENSEVLVIGRSGQDVLIEYAYDGEKYQGYISSSLIGEDILSQAEDLPSASGKALVKQIAKMHMKPNSESYAFITLYPLTSLSVIARTDDMWLYAEYITNNAERVRGYIRAEDVNLSQ